MNYSLTNPQNSIWLTEKFYKNTSVNNICGYVYISDSVNFDALKKAINELVKTNDSMRFKFKEENSSCVQYVDKYKEFDIDVFDLNCEEDIEKKALEVASVPFEIDNNFLFKFILFKLPNNSGGFIINVHHIIGDSWTLGLVAKEVTKIYSELLSSSYESKPYPSYKNYINSEKEYINSDKYIKDKAYWDEVFKTVPEVATIPSIKETNSKTVSCKGNREKFIIPEEQINEIKDFCTKNKISVYNFFMAVYSLYLGRVSNLDDFVIGTPILNRTNFEQKHTMGMFISTAPLRINLGHNVSFMDFSKTIASSTMSTLRHQRYPYQSILETLRKKDSSIPNLYNVVLSYQITKTIEENSNIKYSTDWVFNGSCADDIQIHLFDLNDEDSITVAYDYKVDKYDSQDIKELHARILTIINQVIDNNSIILKDIEIVTPEEKHKILYEFNNTKVDYPKDKTIVDLFEEQVEKTPDNIAVVFEDQKLTYRELNEKANQLAHYLKSLDIKNNDIVSILYDRSLEIIVSILAVLKAGAAYLPLDPNYPKERLEYIFNDCKSKYILTNDISKKDEYSNAIIYSYTDNSFENYDKSNLKINIPSGSASYLIYTSGSTGTPKGVILKHLSLTNLAYYCNNYVEYLKNPENISIVSVTTVSFDIFIYETLISLQRGLKVVIANSNQQTLPVELNKLIEKENIQAIQTTPSRMQAFYNNIDIFNNLKNLKYITLAGEQLPVELAQKLHSISGAKIYNGYGPSETTVFATLTDVTDKNNQMTIGRPLSNTQIYILDSNKNLCPIGVHGEIYISGDDVGLGYVNNSDLTKKSFIENPFIPDYIMYKSGDLGYYNANGEIICSGRIDHQIKIRGLRIELEEIETVIKNNSNIDNCVVSKVTNSSGNECLCVYFTHIGPVNVSVLKSTLYKKLPNYMVPDFFVELDALPYTPNGKIDKKRLPSPSFNSDNSIVEARNNTDKFIISTLSDLLKVDNISLLDSFYSLGGDSLTAISLSASLYKEFKISVSIQDILNYPVIQDLSNYIDSLSGKRSINTIQKAEKMKYYPLSSAQKRMYYSSSLDNNSTLYNIAGGIIVDKILDINKLNKCFNTLINRHEALRTHFDIIDNEVVQIIDDNIDFNLVLDNENTDDLNKIYTDFVKPFDLSKAPLFRTKLVKLADNKMLLLLDMHHIISDGTSLGILLQELCSLYNGSTLSDKQIDYKDFTLWEKEQFESDEFKNSKEYWVSRFKDEIPLLNMSTTNPRPSVQSFEGSNYHTTLSKEVFDKVSKVAKQLNITPYMLMLSTYYILLSKYTSQDDIVVGTPIVGRELPELSNMLGMFVNTLSLRNKVEHSLSFEEFSKAIKESCLNSFKNQSYPFDMLVKDLNIKRDTSRSPLFDVMFIYQNNGYPDINFRDANTDYFIPDNNVSKFDLSLEIIPIDNQYDLRFEYCTKLFDEEFIKRLSSHYINILNAILENTEVKIADIDMLSEEEKSQILYEFNNTNVDYPKNKTIVDLFEEQVKKTPDNIAVVFEDEKLTYRELNEKANQLAHYLVLNNVQLGDIVGIYLNKSLEVIVSMFAILKAGAAFLPLDIDYPEERLKYILDNSKPKVILSSKLINKEINCNKIFVDLDNSLIYNIESINNLNFKISTEDIMYVMYTSGSTGKPKGVMVKHKNIIRLAMYPNFINFSKQEAMVQTGTLVFDACIFEIFGSLLHGFKLYLIGKENLLDIEYFSEFLEEKQVTILFLTTGLFNQFGLEKPDMFKNLKYLLTGGDVISKQSSQKILTSCNNLKVINCYGPTENGSYSTCYQVVGNEYNIPIGKPITNSCAYIVSNNSTLCPIGVSGELWVGGDGVAKGYLNNEVLTKEKFIKNPFGEGIIYKTGDLVKWLPDGNIEFIGRIDNQVKVRGFRIELSEIDNNILTYSNIKQSVSIIHNINDTKFICSYVVAEDTIDTKKLKEHLTKTLASYMIPTHIIQLDKLPLNINGKVDKKLLPLPAINNKSTNIIAARNNIDKTILSVLNKYINTENISIDDNFFDLGIDSLSSISLANNISKELEVQITIKDIFNHPVIRELSDYISNLSEKRSINTIQQAEKMEYYPLSSAQKRMYYSSSLDNSSTLYNIAGGIIVDKILDINKLNECFNTLINSHDALRTHFDIVDNEVVQIIDNNIDFKLVLDNTNKDDLNKIYFDFIKPFDLSKAPLFRTKLVKLADNKMLLLLDMHHIISDGTSLGILLQELCSLYNGSTLSDKQIDYKDFTLWEKEQFESDEFKNSKEYWVNCFKDEIPLLNMPTTNPRPSVQSFEGSNYHTTLSKEVFDKVSKVAKQLNITPYMLMLSTYYILLSKYTSQDDIVVGTPIVGRELPELSNMLGMFVNTLALRNKVEHSLTFEEFSKTIKENCLNSFKNQSYPFDMLVKDLNIKRDTSRSPLFDVMFIYQNNGYPDINFRDANTDYFIPDNNVSKFDLSLEIIPIDNQYDLRFEYCTKLFDEEFIKRLSSHYINILNAILENTEVKISDIDMLSENEKNQILYEFNNIEEKTNNDTFITLFEDQVKKYPNNIALICDDKKLTYLELNEKANSLAHFLINNNVKQNDIVAIMTDRSLETIVCMLGILKAGAAFVNMDPTYPIERTTYYLKDCKAKCVLKQKHLELPINKFKNVFEIDLNISEIYDKNMDNPNIDIDLQSLSYIIYTSGSTGIPKGVVLNHIGLANMCKAMTLVLDYLKDGTKHTLLSVTSTPFDIFVYEIVVPLTHGMKIVMANNAEHRNPKLVDELIRKYTVDVMTVTPSLMKINYDNREPDSALANVKNMVFGGEPLSEKFIRDLKTLSSDITIYNIYGPSEITVLSNVQNLDGEKKITVGPPILNTKIYVLDNDMNPVPIGFPGEIYIGGIQVGCGYLGKEDLTNQKFITNPFAEGRMFKSGDIGRWTKDGKLQCLGRFDHQVKLRGLRIELGEIEKLLEDIPEVDEAVVNKVTVNGKEALCAYYVLNSDIDESFLKNTLRDKLPYYMVPGYFMKLDCMPYSINRKIDRKALPIPNENNINFKTRINSTTKLSATAQKLLYIWKAVLNTSNIDINDNFFDIGGDSLAAIQVQIEAVKAGLNIDYSDIFKYPTIKQLSGNIKRNECFDVTPYTNDKIVKLLKKNNDNELTTIHKTKIRNILVIGTTGYLGVHLIHEFLTKHKGNVYCLIRPKNRIEPQQRLEDIFTFYFGKKCFNKYKKRMIIIKGDITLENMGMSENDINIVKNKVDTVINSGALVKHYGESKLFEDINVLGTQNVTNFCKKNNIRLLHISTISVSGNGERLHSQEENDSVKKVFSEQDLYIGQQINGIYTYTKFKAESIVLNAISKGLEGMVLRIGNITNRYSDGVFQRNYKDNAFAKRIKSFIEIGAFPEYFLEHEIELTPVDLCAEAIIKILFHSSPCSVLHIYNNNLLSIKLFIDTLNELNILLTPESNKRMQEIITSILEDKDKKDIISGIIYDLDNNKNLVYTSNISLNSDFSNKYLSKIGFSWKKTNRNYLKRCLKYFNKIGFINF